MPLSSEKGEPRVIVLSIFELLAEGEERDHVLRRLGSFLRRESCFHMNCMSQARLSADMLVNLDLVAKAVKSEGNISAKTLIEQVRCHNGVTMNKGWHIE